MKNKNLLHSFKYAISGIISAFKSERNLKIHVSITILIIILGIYFKINTTEWVICVLIISQVIGAELFNTSLEEAVNLTTTKIHPLAKLSKDISAGAVLINAIASVIIGGFIFGPKIIALIFN